MTAETSSSSVETFRVEDLLRHEPWLRRLLARLVAPDEVDDAMQQTWLSVLGKRPRQLGRAKAWLSTIARNVAVDTLRARRRRQVLHASARLGRPEESSADACARLELQQHVVQAVLALPAMYRDTLLRRYYQDQSVAMIATAMAVSEANVRQRLKRASVMLREELATEYGEDWRLAAPVVALAQAATPMASATATVWLPLVLLLLVFAVPVFFAFRWSTDTARPEPIDSMATGAGQHVRLASSDREPQHRTAVTSSTSEAMQGSKDRDPTSSEVPLRGRVIDARGLPLADVPVGLTHRVLDSADANRVAGPVNLPLSAMTRFEELARTDARGEFALITDIPIWSSLVVCIPWAPLVSFGIEPQSATRGEAVLVAARAVSVAGRVVDANGRGVSACPIQATLRPLTELSTDWSGSMPIQWLSTATDADGAFRLDGIPAEGVDLRFGDRQAIERPAPAVSELEWIVALSESPAPVLTGVVLDAALQPVAGARVGTGQTVVRTDAEGIYSLTVPRYIQSPAPCFVAARGFEVVRADVDFAGTASSVSTSWNPQLVTPSAAMRGRVVDAEGQPVGGLQVALWDATDLGHGLRTEGLATVSLSDHGYQEPLRATTDKDGRFVLSELSVRRYQLVIWSADEVHVQRTAALDPRVDEHALVWAPRKELLQGVVVDATGQPVVGMQVQRSVCVSKEFSTAISVHLDATDAQGSFTCWATPEWATVRFSLGGSGWAASTTTFEGGVPLGGLRLVAHRECKFRVDLSPEQKQADAFRLLDAEGVALQILHMRGFGGIASTEFGLTNGRSEVLSVGSQAVLLVLLRDDQEVERMPVQLQSGEVQVLGR